MPRSSRSATPSAPLADPISVPNVEPSTLDQETGPSTLTSSPICLSPPGSPDHGPNPRRRLPTSSPQDPATLLSKGKKKQRTGHLPLIHIIGPTPPSSSALDNADPPASLPSFLAPPPPSNLSPAAAIPSALAPSPLPPPSSSLSPAPGPSCTLPSTSASPSSSVQALIAHPDFAEAVKLVLAQLGSHSPLAHPSLHALPRSGEFLPSNLSLHGTPSSTFLQGSIPILFSLRGS